MGRWLKKVQNTPDSRPTQLTQLGSVGSVSAPSGAFAKNDPVPVGDPAGPAKDIDTIIEVLTQQVGRPLGDELIGLMREAMRPMSRPARADLAAAIDDCFEHAESVQAGRQQATELVSTAIPQDEGLGQLADEQC